MIEQPGPSFPSSIENYVALTAAQYELGSLILMLGYGAQFAFVLYFLYAATQLAPRYRVVAVLSAVVMLSSGLSLLREATLWQDAYSFSEGLYRPFSDGNTFSNIFRYGNWLITTPILLIQLGIALGLGRPDLHRRAARMIVATTLMILTGMIGQYGESGDFARLNLWGVVSTVFFVWLIVEVRGVINIGVATSPAEIKVWPQRLFWFFLASWGLYPIAYALPQMGATGDVVVWRQFVFGVADLTSKLVYGIILSRYLLRRSALEGYQPAMEALDTRPQASAIASANKD